MESVRDCPRVTLCWYPQLSFLCVLYIEFSTYGQIRVQRNNLQKSIDSDQHLRNRSCAWRRQADDQSKKQSGQGRKDHWGKKRSPDPEQIAMISFWYNCRSLRTFTGNLLKVLLLQAKHQERLQRKEGQIKEDGDYHSPILKETK